MEYPRETGKSSFRRSVSKYKFGSRSSAAVDCLRTWAVDFIQWLQPARALGIFSWRWWDCSVSVYRGLFAGIVYARSRGLQYAWLWGRSRATVYVWWGVSKLGDVPRWIGSPRPCVDWMNYENWIFLIKLMPRIESNGYRINFIAEYPPADCALQGLGNPHGHVRNLPWNAYDVYMCRKGFWAGRICVMVDWFFHTGHLHCRLFTGQMFSLCQNPGNVSLQDWQ